MNTENSKELLDAYEGHVELLYSLLNWAQIQTGRMAFTPKLFDLSACLRTDMKQVRMMDGHFADAPAVKFGLMFGIVAKGAEGLQVHNRICEIRITDYFVFLKLSKWREHPVAESPASEIIKNSVFDMELYLTTATPKTSG